MRFDLSRLPHYISWDQIYHWLVDLLIVAMVVYVLIVAFGCVTIEYSGPHGEQFRYFRSGDQKLRDIAVSKNPDGTFAVTLGQEESTGNVDLELIRVIQSLLPLTREVHAQ